MDFRLADAHGEVRDALRRIDFEEEHGPLETGQTIDLVVSQWQGAESLIANHRSESLILRIPNRSGSLIQSMRMDSTIQGFNDP